MKPWLFRAGYAVFALGILVLEGVAIANGDKGDTISENVWNVVFSHPLVWLVSLGATGGLALWAVRHLWWRKR